MRKSLLFTLIALVLIVTGCNKNEPKDVSQLLSTVPADASFVMTVDLEDLLEKAGCEIKGSEIVPGEAVKRLIAKADTSRESRFVRLFFNGESGIDPTVLTAFFEGEKKYFTGGLADPDKFRKSIAELLGGEFATSDGIDYLGCVALKANQFWIMSGPSPRINVADVNRFLTLAEGQSILAAAGAERLQELDHDLVGWGNISGMLRASSIDFSQAAMYRVVLESVFEDANAIEFYADIKDDRMESSMTVTNSKGKLARFLLPVSEVDIKAIASIGGNADVLVAASVPKKLINHLKKQFAAGNTLTVMSIYLNALSCIDGTAAIAAENGNKDLAGVITTTGEGTTELSQALTGMIDGTVTKDGKYLRLASGVQPLTQGMPVKDMAEYLKGSMGGMVALSDMFKDGASAANPAFSHVALTLHPDGAGLKMEVNLYGKKGEKHLLVSLLEDI